MRIQDFIKMLDEELTISSLQFNSAFANNSQVFNKLRIMIHLDTFLDNLAYQMSKVKIAAHFGKLDELPKNFTDELSYLLRQLKIYGKSLFSAPEVNLQHLSDYINTGREMINLVEIYMGSTKLDDYVIGRFRTKDKNKFPEGNGEPGFNSFCLN